MCSDAKSLVAVLILSCAAMPVNAASLPGQSCSQVGTTQLSDDKASVIACVYTSSTDTTLVWKAMTPLTSLTTGDLRVGSISPKVTSQPYYNGTWGLANYGRALFFSGGPVTTGIDSDNSDELWIARYNVAANMSELRVNIGDDPYAGSEEDSFVVGVHNCCSSLGTVGAWVPLLTVKSSGRVGMGVSSPDGVLDVLPSSPNSNHIVFQGHSSPWQGANNQGAAVHFIGARDVKYSLNGQGPYIQALLSGDNLGPYGRHDLVFFQHGGADYSSSNEVFRIAYNGNVGIGTASPKTTLDVNGAVTIDSGYLALFEQKSRNGADCSQGCSFVKLGNKANNEDYSLGYDPWGNFALNYDSPLDTFHHNLLTVLPSGDATLAGTLSQSSDQRLKRDVMPITGALEKLAAIRGTTFYWKDKARDQSEQIGVVAQEVEKVFPQAIVNDPEGYKSVNYSGLVAPLIEAVKELKAVTEKQEREIKALREALADSKK